MWQYLVYSLRIRRVEYRVAELPIFFIPVLLTVTNYHELVGAVMWEGLIAFLFLFALGDLLNCLADRELDAIYKPQLTQAVYGIGVRGVVLQAVFSAVGSVGLTLHVAMLTDRWLLVPMVLIGLLTAWAYSMEPVRLKGRGLWQLLFYWLGLFLAPMIFAACLFTDFPSGLVLLVCMAFASVQTGVILVNTAEDYPEDREMNVRTVVVALGLRRGIGLAFWLTCIGSVLLVGAFLWSYFNIYVLQTRIILLLPLLIATCYCVLCTWRLRSAMHSGTDDDMAIAIVKRAAKRVPIWMTSIAVSSLIAAAAVSPALRTP